MSKIKIYYVDDKEGEARRYKRLLEDSGDFKIDIEKPTVEIGDVVPTETPDIFLIDHRLDAKLTNGGKEYFVSYNGTTLTTALRGEAPNTPVVLITKESIISPQRRRMVLKELQVIDDIIYKSEIVENCENIVYRLTALVSGFEILRSIPEKERNWENILEVLKAMPEESKQLKRAAPPLYESTWDISLLADWVQNTLIEYPGILYDPVFAATELKIDVDSFLKPEVQQLFRDAKYEGVFAPIDERWWKERMWQIAMDFVEDTQFTDIFSSVFADKEGVELEPARSIVKDETPADTVCYIYHKPVMYKYTVAYRPDNRPPVMDPARVSYKAIQQSEEFQEDLVENANGGLLDKIRDMEL